MITGFNMAALCIYINGSRDFSYKQARVQFNSISNGEKHDNNIFRIIVHFTTSSIFHCRAVFLSSLLKFMDFFF